MKYDTFKKKMDKFFAATPVEKLAEKLKQKGYSFEPCDSEGIEQSVMYTDVNTMQGIPSTPFKTEGPVTYAEAA